MNKKELRTLIRNRKQQFTSQQLAELSFAVVARLLASERLKAAHTILLYYSLADEVDTHTLIDALLASGKRIVLPRVTGGDTMELRVYGGPMTLTPGAYGIMEPTGELFTDYAAIDLAIVPGMAFDHTGNRLGRGKGYYDRLLPKLGGAWKAGLAFDFQIADNVPSDEHDVKMNEIISA